MAGTNLTDADIEAFLEGLDGLKKFIAARKRIEKKIGCRTTNELDDWEELTKKSLTSQGAVFFALGRISYGCE